MFPSYKYFISLSHLACHGVDLAACEGGGSEDTKPQNSRPEASWGPGHPLMFLTFREVLFLSKPI